MSVYTFTAAGPHDYKTADPNDFSTSIYTLFLNDSSLTIEERRKTQAPNGGHYYKVISANFYKVYLNNHGEKYLRALRKTGTGKLFVTKPQRLGLDSFLYKRGFSDEPCPEMIEVIETHLTKILGFKFVYERNSIDNYKNSPEYLCYPFCRTEGNRLFAKSLIEEMNRVRELSNIGFNLGWNGARGLTNALRHAQTKEELIRMLVYKSAIQSEEDYKCLIEHPYVLHLFSSIDLRSGANEALKMGYVDAIFNHSAYMTPVEYLAFKFCLQNLPKKDVPEIHQLLTRLTRVRSNAMGGVELKRLINTFKHYSYGTICNGHNFTFSNSLRRIPVGDRRSFASLFWKEFSRDYLRSEATFTESKNPKDVCFDNKGKLDKEKASNLFIKVMDCFIRAYSQQYLKKAPVDGIERCVALAKDLFDEDILLDENLAWATLYCDDFGSIVSYFNLEKHMSLRYGAKDKSLFSRILVNTDFTAQWHDYLNFGPINHIITAHMGEKNESRNNAMLAMDVEKLLYKVAACVDSELTRLGQECTPKNRMLCLTTTKEQRKYKINWRYLLMGVDPEEIYTYKRGGIRLKKDIEFWVDAKNTLPSEVYKELFNDHVFGTAAARDFNLSFSSGIAAF